MRGLLFSLGLATAGVSHAQESDFHEVGPGLGGGHGHGSADTIFDHPETSVGFFLDGAFRSDDGLDAEFTSAELVMQSRFAPIWMGYSVLEADEDEARLSEAALVYYGLGGRSSLSAGRFFLDFGKQMPTHVHDLTTPSRPGVLREYLGEEVSGDGLQFDHWYALGDDASLRFSVAAFAAFEAHRHPIGGEEHEHGGDVEQDAPALAARLTGSAHVGEGALQLGASYRGMSEFTASADELGFADVAGLSNGLVGLDLTYSWGGRGGEEHWSVGGEYLSYSGDISVEENDTLPVLEVFDSSVSGWYAFADHQYADTRSYGLMVSAFERPEVGRSEDLEANLYHTWRVSDALRARLALVQTDSQETGDSTAVVLQLTSFFGDHGHAHAHAHSH